MIISALFIISPSWRKPRFPSVGKWISKLWYIYVYVLMECTYLLIKKKLIIKLQKDGQWYLIFISLIYIFNALRLFIQSQLTILGYIRNSLIFFLTPVTIYQYSSVQFSRSVVTLCDPMDCSTPGLPVHHRLNGHEFE